MLKIIFLNYKKNFNMIIKFKYVDLILKKVEIF